MALPLETFQQSYIELVNDDDLYVTFEEFCKTGETSLNEAKRFIIETPNFANRLHTVLQRVVPAISSDIPVDVAVDRCLDHCKHSLSFCIRDLSEIVQGLRDDKPSIPEQEPPATPNQNNQNQNQLRTFVLTYEKQVNRPMYAMELLLLSQHATCPESVVTLAANMRKAYDVVADMVVKYQGRHISEHDFITHWLDKIVPLEDYAPRVERLRRNLLGSDQYVSVMKQRVCSKYSSLFGQVPTEDDVEYFFKRIAATEMHLLDDGMDQMLVEMYREKQDDIEEITGVYENTYGRGPDTSELEQALRDYRCPRTDYELSNEKLRRVLCADLEYHDVVKRKIIDAYQEEDQLTTRVMYAVLKKVLRAVPNLHDTETLDAVIRKLVDDIPHEPV